MVLKEGQENGIGVWEIEGYENIEPIIKSLVKDKIEEQEHLESKRLTYDCTLVVGSYGSGLGVPEESDLDLIILVSFRGDNRSYDFSEAMKKIAGKVNKNKNMILSKYNQFTDLEAYVYPYLEKQKHLAKMASHEPIDYYYDLTEDKKKSYYR